MAHWPATKARRVLKALLSIGWRIKREADGSHKILARPGWPDFVWAFHGGVEIGPRGRIAKRTGLRREDL